MYTKKFCCKLTKRLSVFLIFSVLLFVESVQPVFASIYRISPKDVTAYSLTTTIAGLKPGDTLYFNDGTYPGGAQFKVSGTETAPIILEGSERVLFNGKRIAKNVPVFQTNGQSYLQFKNLSFHGVRAGVQIDGGSHHILIDGLRADHCQFAVKMKDASFVTVQNSFADNSRNAFRGEGDTHDVEFLHVKAFNSKDIYKGYDLKFLNGDGFIFEKKTYNLRFENIISANHWDAGLDIKGSHVQITHVESYGCKNGVKLWGEDITVRDALLHEAKSQERPDGSKVDGAGIHLCAGSAVLLQSTLVDNEQADIKINAGAKLSTENCVVARKLPKGNLWHLEKPSKKDLEKNPSKLPGELIQKNVIAFQPNAEPLSLPPTVVWVDPQFENWEEGNYCLRREGPAYQNGIQVLGAICRKPVKD